MKVLVLVLLVWQGLATAQNRPPQPLIHDLAPGEATKQVQEAIALLETELGLIVKIQDPQRNFKNTIEARTFAFHRFSQTIEQISHLKLVSPNKALRDEIFKVQEDIVTPFLIRTGLRRDCYDAIQAALKNIDLSTLTPAQRRLVELTEKSLKDSGAALPDETKAWYQLVS